LKESVVSEHGDTKARILDTAERLFAEKGYAETSMRCITSGARVNLASVNYHFGSKEALLMEVITRRIGPVNAARMSLLDEIEDEAGDDAPELEKVVRAFLLPAIKAIYDAGEQGKMFVRLIGRTHSETNDNIRNMFMNQFKETLPRFAKLFQRALPGISAEEVRMRMFFMVGAMAHSMAMSHKVDWLPQRKETLAHLGEVLVHFTTAGMSAAAAPTFEQVSQS
jgi:AcrR family transcriptional regulator